MAKRLTKGQSIAIAYATTLSKVAKDELGKQIDKALASARKSGVAWGRDNPISSRNLWYMRITARK